MKDNTRLYGIIKDIDENAVQSFYNNRAEKENSIRAVLLNQNLSANVGEIRNSKEKDILLSNIEKRKYNILDIGCGYGRWAKNLMNEYICTYDGIDFSEKFINSANDSFSDYQNINFINMSATQLDYSKLKDKYNLIIVTGVCMYINDDKLQKLFKDINNFMLDGSYLYIQDSVSVIKERLTLSDFYSEELKCLYSAIYRTPEEYKMLLNKNIHKTKIIAEDYLLTPEIGARKETNAYYYLIQKGNKNDRK